MPKNGYTLIELLVVLTIMAILTIVVFINYKTFSQDQILKKATGEIQSLLRLAQSNATTSLTCPGSTAGVSWAVKFLADKETLHLTCGPATFQKSLRLENVQIDSIKCSPAPATCPQTGFNTPLIVSFTPLYGKVTFIKSGEFCVDTAQSVMVVLKNLKNNNNKCFTISKGGAIDVQ